MPEKVWFAIFGLICVGTVGGLLRLAEYVVWVIQELRWRRLERIEYWPTVQSLPGNEAAWYVEAIQMEGTSCKRMPATNIESGGYRKYR